MTVFAELLDAALVVIGIAGAVVIGVVAYGLYKTWD